MRLAVGNGRVQALVARSARGKDVGRNRNRKRAKKEKTTDSIC